MATPVGHVLAGCAVGWVGASGERRHHRPLLVTCGLLAVAPDLDFLPGVLLGQPALYHQGPSHSVAAALAASVVAALAFRAAGSRPRCAAPIFFAAYVSHLVLDLFGPDERAPYGIPLLWPFSDQAFLAPVTLLRGVDHAESTSTGTAAWLERVVSLQNLEAVALEALWVAPLIAVAGGIRLWCHRQRARTEVG